MAQSSSEPAKSEANKEQKQEEKKQESSASQAQNLTPEQEAKREREKTEAKALEKKRADSWQERMANDRPLTRLEEAKADADFNYHMRESERKAREEFEAKKRGKLSPSQRKEASDDEDEA